MALTTVIAIYAAVVSTAVFIWTLRKDLKDRGELSISLRVGFPIKIDRGEASRLPKQISIRVVNRGRRACTLGSIGLVRRPSWIGWGLGRLLTPGEQRLPLSVNGLPKRLEYEDVWTASLDWKSFYLTPYGKTVSLYAEDTLGRTAFTGCIRSDYLKDPEFENEDELPYTIDDSLRKELTRNKRS